MAQMLQHTAKSPLHTAPWPTKVASGSTSLDSPGTVVLRPPSATQADAGAMSIKRQGIIIPSEFKDASSDDIPTAETRRPQLAALDIPSVSIKETQAVIGASTTHLATPTDSNTGRSGSFDIVNGDLALLFSPKSDMPGSGPASATAAPAGQRRRLPFKIPPGVSSSAFTPPPSVFVPKPLYAASTPAYSLVAMSAQESLRRTRSQSPTEQQMTMPISSHVMSDPDISSSLAGTAAAFSTHQSGAAVASSVRLAHRRRPSVRVDGFTAPPHTSPILNLSEPSDTQSDTPTTTPTQPDLDSAATAAAAELAASSLPSPQMHSSDFVHGTPISAIMHGTGSSQESAEANTQANEPNADGISLFLPETGGGGFESADARFGNTAGDDKPLFEQAETKNMPRLEHDNASSRRTSTILMVAATEENSEQSADAQKQQPSLVPNWFKRQTMRSNTNGSTSSVSSHTLDGSQQPEPTISAAHYEALMLRAQEQRNVALAEANTLQQQLFELRLSKDSEIERMRTEIDTLTRKLGNEYELRTAAEAKCSQMECELAELSSHIQYEAQNLVAHERREHRDELARAARKHAEINQLLEMERAQVSALKQSLETTSIALDRERNESERMRSGMQAFEKQISVPASKLSTDDPVAPPVLPEPHISGLMYFGNDASRTDTRLTEFLGFLNAASEKEAQASAFMQRSMREDIAPTLLADGSSAMPSLSSWHRHRRLLHSVQENTLLLESFAPRRSIGRVMSLGCYLCGCSINRPSSSGASSSASASVSLSMASNSLDRGMSTSSGNAETTATTRSRQSGAQRCEMYRMRFNDNDEDNKPLCLHCHGRMVSVCSFFAYLKIVRKGLIKRPIADIWLEVNKTRLKMWLARSGASPDSQLTVSMT
ncbi:hypothetical protein GGI15_003840 [Coemansia interrupta]|uniref:GDP/GTP exchange factor Sec2 N-terminal domain-containing protein n=1 Tax=Coemansia interrupta TaxID=1126814 RepID=A0A9W8HDP9_9FUNG|nr:hypothetical protein GGI15_003840 [Coemansia interrupta]